MDARLSIITIGVDDMTAQKAFYKDILGWKPEAENKDIVFFKLNGILLSLFDRKTLAGGVGMSPDGSGFRAITLSQNVSTEEEVNKAYNELKGKGVRILVPPTTTPFGALYFAFADTEDNVLEVTYNPYTPLDAAGDVITHHNIDNL
ncbi:MAG: VOC family protein [Chitinophagaceae bacterium]|nr:MAG: VOC family protein [Chitinophagaceae bacterium]